MEVPRRRARRRRSRRPGTAPGSASHSPSATSCSTSRPMTQRPTSSARRSRASSTDPEVRELLTPRDHPFGAKRPVVDDGYFADLQPRQRHPGRHPQRPDRPGHRGRARALLGRDVRPRRARVRHRIRRDDRFPAAARGRRPGRDHVAREVVRRDRVTYLGLGTHGFPNMFVIAGPGSPALLINVLVGIELHIDWLAAMFAAMDAVDATVVEVERQAELDWGAHLNATRARRRSTRRRTPTTWAPRSRASRGASCSTRAACAVTATDRPRRREAGEVHGTQARLVHRRRRHPAHAQRQAPQVPARPAGLRAPASGPPSDLLTLRPRSPRPGVVPGDRFANTPGTAQAVTVRSVEACSSARLR